MKGKGSLRGQLFMSTTLFCVQVNVRSVYKFVSARFTSLYPLHLQVCIRYVYKFVSATFTSNLFKNLPVRKESRKNRVENPQVHKSTSLLLLSKQGPRTADADCNSATGELILESLRLTKKKKGRGINQFISPLFNCHEP